MNGHVRNVLSAFCRWAKLLPSREHLQVLREEAHRRNRTRLDRATTRRR